MIPLIDDFLMCFIACKLKILKEHPGLIDLIFHSARKETIDKLKDFIINRKIKVTIGYPKDQNYLPCYVITLAPEQEQPAGLGDNFESFSEDDYDLGIGEDEISQEVAPILGNFLASTYMNSNYRIECWSDNGDLTSYMYVILKWALWSSRQEMHELGWVNVRLSGTDLEPVPDYMPTFIYRRSAQINMLYDNLYYEKVDSLGKYINIIENPDDYHKDEDGNIVDNEGGEIVVPASETWILVPHYYDGVIEV